MPERLNPESVKWPEKTGFVFNHEDHEVYKEKHVPVLIAAFTTAEQHPVKKENIFVFLRALRGEKNFPSMAPHLLLTDKQSKGI